MRDKEGKNLLLLYLVDSISTVVYNLYERYGYSILYGGYAEFISSFSLEKTPIGFISCFNYHVLGDIPRKLI